MTASTGPMRAVAASGRPLAYLPPEFRERALALIDQWEGWLEHAEPMNLASWAGRAAALMIVMVADSPPGGGIPQ